MSVRGYWRTDSERIDCNPAIRMTRLTTIARTGRRMKRSVIFMSTTSVVLRPWGRVVGRLNLVVDLHRDTVPQLEYAGGHHLVAGMHAVQHGHLIPARAA